MFKAFHSLGLHHGSTLENDWADAEAKLSEAGVTFHHYSCEDGHMILTENVKLFFPGSQVV